MGLLDIIFDIASVLTFAEAQAEAPFQVHETQEGQDRPEELKRKGAADEGEDQGADDGGGEGKPGGHDGEGRADGGEGEGEGGEEKDEEEEEDEEEDEPVDPKPKLEADCASSRQCAPYKNHYDECVERVTEQQEHAAEHKGPKEDCVEEFFHLTHCATQCAAPKLFAQLK